MKKKKKKKTDNSLANIGSGQLNMATDNLIVPLAIGYKQFSSPGVNESISLPFVYMRGSNRNKWLGVTIRQMHCQANGYTGPL